MKNNKILFVCLGNICRSPTAESIFRKKSSELKYDLFLDSAGTSNYHINEKSDSRSIDHAKKRGYEMTHLARQVQPNDFENFDLIFAMDKKNLTDLIGLCPSDYKNKIKLITDFCEIKNPGYIPDPYYGSPQDFELVLNLLESCWEGFKKNLN